ncbi:carboxypeptidase regulatory-like domain-containing protein [Corallococcus sp. Z5C101001]|nr:carboxypeptidase regulatory-like domain-containing protein [Corallococcus sp. Z5C101001]
MRWSWVGLVAALLACAGSSRSGYTRWPMDEVALAVRAVDGSGQPVPGVTVRVRRADHGSLVARSGTTDAAGVARLQVMPGWYIVQTEAGAFANVTRTDVRLAPGTEARLDLKLEPAVPFAGHVLDAAGKPVAGVRLRLVRSDDVEPLSPTESDADGRFRFEGVAAGTVVLHARKKGWNPLRLEIPTPTSELTVMLEGLSSLRLQVLDPQGRPLLGDAAWIRPVEREDDVESFTERTAESTVFRQLPAGRYLITGRYAPAPGCWWERTIEFQIPSGQQVEGAVSFEGIHGIGPWRGRAVDPTGRALGGIVRARMGPPEAAEPGLRGACEARTESDGHFVLPQVLGVPAALTLEAPEPSKFWRLEGGLPAENGASVVFRSGEGLLVGRVLRPDGKPQEHFRIDGTPVQAPQGEYARAVPLSHGYQWFLDAEGFAPALVRSEGRVNEELTVRDIVLEEGRTVRGRVVTDDGRTGVPMQEVELVETFDLEVRGQRAPQKVLTDPDGRYRFEHVARRLQALRVDAKLRGTVLHELMPGEDAPELRLVPGGELQGSVTDGGRVPLAGVELEVRCEGGFTVSAVTDVAGRYSAHVPGGRECFLHAVARPLNFPEPRSPPVSFSPQRIQLAPSSRQRIDVEPRQGLAVLHVAVNASREFVSAFILPGDVPLPRTPQALYALIRTGFDAEPLPSSWVSEEGQVVFSSGCLSAAAFDFRHLPLGHYTVFIRDETDGGGAVLRVPVDIERAGAHSLSLERPFNVSLITAPAPNAK